MPLGKPLIEVIAVTYKQPGPLAVFVQCFLNQTADNWKLSVWHDGPNPEFDAQMRRFERSTRTIEHHHTERRFNDWGHSLREIALQRTTGDYVLLTNGDNYYVPRFIEAVTHACTNGNPDIVMFNALHSYAWGSNGQPVSPPYTVMDTELRPAGIDMGAAIVKTPLAKLVGFRDKSMGGDGTYFSDLRRLADLRVTKLPSVLFVHN